SVDTSASCRTTSALRRISTARTVTRSAGPGPAPIITTLPAMKLLAAGQRPLGASLFHYAPFVDPLFDRLNDPAGQLIYVADHVQAFTLMLSQRFAYP